MNFSIIDVLIVIIYLAGTVSLGFWIGRNQKDTTDYFLGGRHIPWFAVTLSIVAAETSVLTFISIPAVSYLGNLTFIQIVVGYAIGRVLVALFMIPAYYRGNIETAYHFLGNRFGQKMRNVTSITFMVTRVLADGVRLFATAIPLALIFKGSGLFGGLSDAQFYILSIVVMGVLTMIYTCFGGIRSVVWVDVIQMVVYIGGAVLAALIILGSLPNGLASIAEATGPDDKWRWLYLGTDLTWREFVSQPYTLLTSLVGGAIFSLASHGIDQTIIQRVLTCGNKRASQKAIALTGVVIFFQFILFLTVGILLYTYYDARSVEELGVLSGDGIFPKFIVEQMPVGISGLIVASLFAAAMSSLAGSLSSLSSATMLDIYIPLSGGRKSQTQLLALSRVVTVLWGCLLIGVAIGFVRMRGTALETALGIASYTYGGMLGVFLLGLMYKPAKQRDAIIAFFVALTTMIVFIQTVKIAWPLYIVVGSSTAIITGIVSSCLSGAKAPDPAE